METNYVCPYYKYYYETMYDNQRGDTLSRPLDIYIKNTSSWTLNLKQRLDWGGRLLTDPPQTIGPGETKSFKLESSGGVGPGGAVVYYINENQSSQYAYFNDVVMAYNHPVGPKPSYYYFATYPSYRLKTGVINNNGDISIQNMQIKRVYMVSTTHQYAVVDSSVGFDVYVVTGHNQSVTYTIANK